VIDQAGGIHFDRSAGIDGPEIQESSAARPGPVAGRRAAAHRRRDEEFIIRARGRFAWLWA
jgi:hypothetical protein